MLAPSTSYDSVDRSGLVGASLLVIAGVVLIFAPFTPLADVLGMHYVDPPLPILLVLFLAYQLVLPRLTTKGFAWPASAKKYLPLILIAFFAGMLSWLSIRKHDVIASHTDLAIFDNAMWNTIHGRVLYSSLLQRNFLGEHVAPVLLLLTPVYWLAPGAATLLILQACALAVSALPVYWLAKERLEPRAAFLLLVLYFFNRALLGAAFFDFHEIVFAVPLIAFAFYYSEHRRDGLLVLMLLGALLCKEEVGLIVCGFGIYLWIRRGVTPLAFALIVTGLGVFLIDYNIVLPYLRGRPGPYADRYSYLGTSIPNILWNMLRHPIYVAEHLFTLSKLGYFCTLFGSLAFLPLFAPVHLVPVAPTLLRITLSGLVPEYSLEFHYSALLCPFLFFAAIFAIERVSRELQETRRESVVAVRHWLTRMKFHSEFLRRQAGCISTQDIVMTAILISGGTFGMNPLRFATSPKPFSDVSSIAAIDRSLPAEASLAGDETLVAQFAHRRDLTFLPIVNGADFVLMDFAGDRYEYPLNRQEHRRMLLALAFDDGYGVKLNHDGVVLLQKGLKQDSAERAKLIAPVFFDYPGTELQTRRCHKCDSGLDFMAFTLGHLYPPGKYVATVNLRGSEPGAAFARIEVHAAEHVDKYKSQFEDPRFLLRKEVELPQSAGQSVTVEVPFNNPDWNDLMFRVMLPGRDVSVESIKVHPEAPLEQALQTLKDY